MKLTPSLRNTAIKETSLQILHKKFPLSFKKLGVFILLGALVSSCTAKNPAKNFYSANELPKVVEKLSQEEFNLSVKATLTDNSLWVYFPAEKLLNSNFNLLEKAAIDLDRISMIIGRSILNSPKPPEFYVLFASDIKEMGADYMAVYYSKDLKRYYYSRISRGEFSKRRFTYFKLNIMAINDKEGVHIKPYDIDLSIFLMEQLRFRLEEKFKEISLPNKITLKSTEAEFKDNKFIFKLDFEKVNFTPQIGISEEAFKIISFVLKDYDFKDFAEVSVSENLTGKEIVLSQKALFEKF